MQGLAEWQQPQAGMFAWMKLCGGIKDADQILDKLKEEKVVVVPGWSLVLMKLCICLRQDVIGLLKFSCILQPWCTYYGVWHLVDGFSK